MSSLDVNRLHQSHTADVSSHHLTTVTTRSQHLQVSRLPFDVIKYVNCMTHIRKPSQRRKVNQHTKKLAATNRYYAPFMKRIAIIMLIATSALVSCGGSSDSAVTYETADDLLTALADAGQECTGYEPAAKADRDAVRESAKEVGRCELDNETLDITIWKDSGQRKNWEGMAKTVGCEISKGFGITEFDYVNGDTWTIMDVSKTLAGTLAKTLGGKAVHHEC
jgi:hypothetical protein